MFHKLFHVFVFTNIIVSLILPKVFRLFWHKNSSKNFFAVPPSQYPKTLEQRPTMLLQCLHCSSTVIIVVVGFEQVFIHSVAAVFGNFYFALDPLMHNIPKWLLVSQVVQ